MEGLTFLKAVPNEQVAAKIFSEVFKRRSQKVPDETFSESLTSVLKLQSPEQVEQFFSSAAYLISIAVYENSANLSPLFPENFHQGIRDLCLKLVAENLATWRKIAAADMLSLPRLKDFDWRIDIKRASDTLSTMNVPTVLVQLEIEKPPRSISEAPKPSLVTFELNKQTLDTLVDGLSKIKGQLNSLNN